MGKFLTEDLESSLKTLLESNDEDFQKSALTIFESAVESGVQKEVAVLQEKMAVEYAEKLVEELDEVSEKVQFFLEELATEYVTENLDTIEKNYRYELAESMLTDLKAVFEKHSLNIDENSDQLKEYVELEDEKEKILSDAVKLSSGYLELEEKYNELLSEKEKVEKENLIESISSELTLIQKDKFNSLVSSINEEKSFDDFKQFAESVVNIIKKDDTKGKTNKKELLSEDFKDTTNQPKLAGKMSVYTNFVKTAYRK